MAEAHGKWRRIAALSVAVTGSVVAFMWLMWLLRAGDLESNDKVASVAGMFISLVSLVVSAWSLRVAILQLRQSQAIPSDSSDRLDSAAEILARLVRAQWEAEAALRALRRPAPLRLTWSTTPRTERVSAPADTVVAGTVLGRVVRLRMHGDLDEITTKYLALPHRRLVVLGAPGAGKTVLAMLLTLALLRRRQPGEPVALLLSLASWDPTVEHLHTWLARRLGEDYPALNSPMYGPAAPQQLVTLQRVVPILDGLDELPESLRPAAISELDRARANQPLVVTCRSQEYEQAVDLGGTLSTAAVVELEPVATTEAIAFLRAAPAPAVTSWDSVAAHLGATPDGALATALSTPLMVALARSIYTASIMPARDPGELVRLAESGGQTAVERHLLDGFIPAAYANPPPSPDLPASRHYQPPSPELARRWLTLLATHLAQQHTRDLAWWQLYRLVPQRTLRVAVGMAGALVVSLTVGLVVGLGARFTGLRSEFAIVPLSLLSGLAAGLVGWVIFGIPRQLGGVLPPARVNIQFQGRLPVLRRQLLEALGIGFGSGVVIGLVGWRLNGLGYGLVWGLAGFLLGGFAIGTGTGLVNWLYGPVEDALAVTPQSTFRNDRAFDIAMRLVFGITGGLGCGLAVGLLFAYPHGSGREFALGFVLGLAFGLALGVVGGGGGGTAWERLAEMRLVLAARGQLPLRLMAFLEDAHYRGVLRQAGAVYQFRHARLQDHLADSNVTSSDGVPRHT